MKMIMPIAKPATLRVSQVSTEPTSGKANKAKTGTKSKGLMSKLVFMFTITMPSPTKIVAKPGRHLARPCCLHG